MSNDKCPKCGGYIKGWLLVGNPLYKFKCVHCSATLKYGIRTKILFVLGPVIFGTAFIYVSDYDRIDIPKYIFMYAGSFSWFVLLWLSYYFREIILDVSES